MPASILNLKFKGNKSFVPFSNLNDADSLTMTWKVCTKVASFLEQGQRLENLSWRLWHLQNVMVDTDNAKSKRDFKKLSKCMSDKLDKEKGRSIEELQAPGFRRNHSTELLQQRAAEKEREREANQHGRPGMIPRMQFTFSIDQPHAPSSAPVKKPDLKPSPEFKDNAAKRGRPATRAAAAERDAPAERPADPPLTQRGRKPAEDPYAAAALRFPSLFSSDFGPAALLYPTPSVATALTYGEGVGPSGADGFSIPRPTIELPLDELLGADSPAWPPFAEPGDDDVEMKPAELFAEDAALGALRSGAVEDLVPRTITPTRLGGGEPAKAAKRPALSVRTSAAAARAAGPSATPVNSSAQANNTHSAPGGVKAECSNCGATHTPLWRRGLNDELNCNACGLYCKLHKRPRPKSMRNSHGEGRTQSAPRQESQEVVAQCYNCHTTATPLWRKDDEGKTVCNACGLYYKLHGAARPISMKSDVIRKRARHDARRVGAGGVSETPSASPGASRRASPTSDPTPTLAPDSTTQMGQYGGGDEMDYRLSTSSELMGALGNPGGQHGPFAGQNTYYQVSSAYPGPYHPDYLSNVYQLPADALPFAAGEMGEADGEARSSKRRRMSNDSASEPPSSAVSFGSYADSYTSASSGTPQSTRSSSMDFAFNAFASYGMLRAQAPWHPPMLPPDASPQFIHPPMLPPDEPGLFMHPPMLQQEEADALFASYVHGSTFRTDDSPPMSSLQLHPPMLPTEWKAAGHYDSYDAQMVSY